MTYSTQRKDGDELNRVYEEDLPVHEWYRFVLSFPPHLVRQYFEKFNVDEQSLLLDPFCGTGTTLVEAKKHGMDSIGIEANPVVHFAASVKTSWSLDVELLAAQKEIITARAHEKLVHEGYGPDYGPLFRDTTRAGKRRVRRELPPEQMKLLIKNSISPRPLHKTLALLETIHEEATSEGAPYFQLALAKQVVNNISNLRFGPEVGVGKQKEDAPVMRLWEQQVNAMLANLTDIQQYPYGHTVVHHGDARQVSTLLDKQSIDAVITSPPYPNEKDYSRTTRLESVLLGYMKDRTDLRKHKQALLRSNTRGVYKADTDHEWVAGNQAVQTLAKTIEERRIELGKTSGFERLYHRVVLLYFGGMARHLSELKPFLKPGAKLAYVVGDQASYLRVMIRTGEILAEIAQQLGYRLDSIDLFRERFSTVTGENLREEVVCLTWPGDA